MSLFTIDGMNACISSHSSSRVSSVRRKKDISWKNKTSGRSYSSRSKMFVNDEIKSKRIQPTVVNRYSIRPNSDVFCYREGLMRKQLGDSLYVRRSELIKELTVLYKASRSVCYLASVNMLKHWLSCYKVADTKRFLSSVR